MFDWILPHQIIWIWIGISGLTGTVVSMMISEGKNPLYILGNIFFCSFMGALAGGFFVAFTYALVWDFWSLLIPVFVGGITSYIIAMFFRDKIPKPVTNVKPIAMFISITMIIVISFASLMPAISNPHFVYNTSGTPVMQIDTGDANVLIPSNVPATSFANIKTFNIDGYSLKVPLNLNLAQTYSTGRLYIKGYKSSVDFPTLMAEDPQEGQYLGFKLSFSVPSTSPVNWEYPMFFVIIWGDANNDGQYENTTDYILSPAYYKIPSSGANIITTASFLYNASDNDSPMIAYYGFPLYFAGLYGDAIWKDDSQYTFYNTPEGFKPPYDGLSYEVYSDGSATLKETISYWIPINIGSGPYEVYGKVFIPYGASSVATNWYITVIAYDPSYSQTEPISQYSLKFTVQERQKPIVNVTGEWWVETALFAMVGVALLAVVKQGGKFAFK